MRELAKEEKRSGHIIDGVDDAISGGIGRFGVMNQCGEMGGMGMPHDVSISMGVVHTLKKNLEALSNTNGCWDGSDDDEQGGKITHSVLVATFVTTSTSNSKNEEEP